MLKLPSYMYDKVIIHRSKKTLTHTEELKKIHAHKTGINTNKHTHHIHKSDVMGTWPWQPEDSGSTLSWHTSQYELSSYTTYIIIVFL